MMLLLAACSPDKTPTSIDGFCAAIRKPTDNHNNALLIDGGPKSVVTGDTLIEGIYKGCNYG